MQIPRWPRLRPIAAMAALSTLLIVTACGAEVGEGDDDGGGTQVLSDNETDPPSVQPTDPPEDPPSDSSGGEEGTGQSQDPEETTGEKDDQTGSSDQSSILLVMDASRSMTEADAEGGQTRLDVAKQSLRDVVDTLPDDAQVGLRVYGHTVGSDDGEAGCRDTELIHPVGPLDREALTSAIDGFQAVGHTPIGYSLQQAAADLPPEGPRSIILVSDGDDTCAPPPPCDVATELAEDGVDLTINTVGFALKDNQQAREELECIAEAGNGEYYDAGNADELTNTLQEVAEEEFSPDQTLKGAEIPSRAETGQINTSYGDRIKGASEYFYRFEIPHGSTVQGEVYFGDQESGTDSCSPSDFHTVEVRDGSQQVTSSFDSGEGRFTVLSGEGVADADAVWLRIDTACGTDAIWDVELRLSVLE